MNFQMALQVSKFK